MDRGMFTLQETWPPIRNACTAEARILVADDAHPLWRRYHWFQPLWREFPDVLDVDESGVCSECRQSGKVLFASGRRYPRSGWARSIVDQQRGVTLQLGRLALRETMPRLVVNSFKHGKLEKGWSWPLTATALTGTLGHALDLDAFLDISFWQQQALGKRERDARLEGRRFRVLELRTALDPSGINRPKEMPPEVPLLIRAWVFPVFMAAFSAAPRLRATVSEALKIALAGEHVSDDRFEIDAQLFGTPDSVHTEVRRWKGLRPLPPERGVLPF
jgi:hypothetical protein